MPVGGAAWSPAASSIRSWSRRRAGRSRSRFARDRARATSPASTSPCSRSPPSTWAISSPALIPSSRARVRQRGSPSPSADAAPPGAVWDDRAVNLFDAGAIVLLVVAVVLGYRSGALPQIGGLLGAVGGGAVAILPLPPAEGILHGVGPAPRAIRRGRLRFAGGGPGGGGRAGDRGPG